MKQPKITDSQITNVRFVAAPSDLSCDGCGEITITKGDTLMIATSPDGETRNYCLRCIFAIDDKMRHAKPGKAVAIERGDLKLNRLANEFRKRWTELCLTLVRHRDTGRMDLYDQAIKDFCTASGVESEQCLIHNILREEPGDRASPAAVDQKEKNHLKYLKQKEQKMKKEQDEIKRLEQERAALNDQLTALKLAVNNKVAEIVKLFLKEKIAAINHNDAHFVEQHAATAAALLELQQIVS